jgi:hypothetical protein
LLSLSTEDRARLVGHLNKFSKLFERPPAFSLAGLEKPAPKRRRR